MATVTIVTLGCKVNQFESEALMASVEKKGYRLVPFDEGADITIINTCTVTHRADFQSRQMARRARRINPDSLIIVTGCYAQVEPEAIARIEGVRYLLGNREKERIPDLLPFLERGGLARIQVSDIQEEDQLPDLTPSVFHRHTRAFVKIQDGCDARCSYCIVPRARGRSRSLPADRVFDHLSLLEDKGFKEVVLTGIHAGAYGLDLQPPFALTELLRALETRSTPPRIRLSSIEPMEFSEDLLALLAASEKICPHLHVPIQSGDDEILRLMNRPYDRAYLTELITELHSRIPEASIGADVIVGFPGETESRFLTTVDLIESLPLSYLHVFPFSKRKGTPASRLPQPVDEATIARRAENLRGLGKRKRQAFYRRFLGREVNVLIEDRKDKKSGRYKGLSRNYLTVHLAKNEKGGDTLDFVNQEVPVLVTDLVETGVLGVVTEGSHG